VISALSHAVRRPGTTRLRWLIVAVDAVTAVSTVGLSFIGVPGNEPSSNAIRGLAFALAAVVLQVHLSFAVARRESAPRGWLILLALSVCVYLPMLLLGLGTTWLYMQAYVIASLPMVLRRWPAATVALALVVATDVWVVQQYAGEPVSVLVYWVWYVTGVLAVTAAPIYGVALLVRTVSELRATRAELATLAAERERLRISRDLHDLLGQSLTAVSFKGELALRLLTEDRQAARAEIESLTGLARNALHGVRRVALNEQAVSLRGELEGAAALLAAVGIDAHIDFDRQAVPPAVEELLAWTLREGITNIIRHSHATTCSIVAGHLNGEVFLEMINDGARAEIGEGSGLPGLIARANASSGAASAEWMPGGRFRLYLKVPDRIA
jgi:two-component system sensor histidine kinase DesK